MGSKDNLNGDQFVDALQIHISPGYALAEHPEHGYVGEMSYDNKTREIGNIEVKPNFRRHGIATALWNSSQPLSHSTIRTSQGTKWAKAVGGEVPRRVIPK